MEKKGFLSKGEDEPWRVLEFYSGIGGMRYSIISAGVEANMVEAFDINDKANDVYQHNFGHRPYQRRYIADAMLNFWGAYIMSTVTENELGRKRIDIFPKLLVNQWMVNERRAAYVGYGNSMILEPTSQLMFQSVSRGYNIMLYVSIGDNVYNAFGAPYRQYKALPEGVLTKLLELKNDFVEEMIILCGLFSHEISHIILRHKEGSDGLKCVGIHGALCLAAGLTFKLSVLLIAIGAAGYWPRLGNIQTLNASALDKYGAHAWLLSPPCQPYTRQGLQKDSGDARAFSFLKILELIPHLSNPPLMIFVENVVGFETSDTHKQMIEILVKTGFTTQEYILSPLQFAVPYSRPRYFCLAKRQPLNFRNPQFNNQLLWTPSPLLGCDDRALLNGHDQPHEGWEKWVHLCEPVESFLESNNASNQPENAESRCYNKSSISTMVCEDLDEKTEENNSGNSSRNRYMVPLSLIERWGSAMDIVYPDSQRCCCFTKSYYRYVKGTGSLLATIQPEQKGKISPLEEQGLRYFTPREVANLHSFPEDFHFPQHISLRQRYALLGNSLSIAVVAPLLRYLFTEPP